MDPRGVAFRHPWWITSGLILVVLAVFGVAPTLLADTTSQLPTRSPSGHVVLVGVPGAEWSAVSRSATPRLFATAENAGLASLSVRTVEPTTCLTDGWLTLSAGRRATSGCAPAKVTVADDGSATVVNWAMLRDRQRRENYDARPGLLGDAAAAAGARMCAIGPEAAVGAADTQGRVPAYWPTMPSTIDPSCAITLIAGTDLEAATADLADSLAGGNTTTDVYLSGISDRANAPATTADAADTRAGLRILLHVRFGRTVPTTSTWLTSSSTRWTGMAQLTDLTPTLLTDAGAVAPTDLVGTRVVDTGNRGGSETDTTRDIRTLVTTNDRSLTGVLAGWSAVGISILTAIGTLVAVRIRNARGGSRAVGRGAGAAALSFVAWVPLCTYLSKLIPLATRPSAVIQTAIATLALAAVASALLIGWLGRHPRNAGLLAVTMISGITGGILGLDTVLGGFLQQATPFGNNPILAGRFYGIRNLTFGLFAAGVLLAAAGCAFFAARSAATPGRGRAVAVRAVATIGLAGILIDGLPSMGADVGGMLALTPGVLLLALLVGGVRLTWLRLIVVAGAGIVVFLVVAGLDYSRPVEERTHIGQFAARVFDGEAWTVLTRKMDDNLHATGSPLVAVAVLVVLVATGLAVCLPTRVAAARVGWGGLRRSLQRLDTGYDTWPSLRFGVWSLTLTGVLGMLANDSGLMLGAAVLLPLLPALGIAGVLAPRRRR